MKDPHDNLEEALAQKTEVLIQILELYPYALADHAVHGVLRVTTVGSCTLANCKCSRVVAHCVDSNGDPQQLSLVWLERIREPISCVLRSLAEGRRARLENASKVDAFLESLKGGEAWISIEADFEQGTIRQTGESLFPPWPGITNIDGGDER